ncbi:MAG: ABC transporter substrate-binding protein, partial [Bacteroidetes bacterium]|nr:ABC transporter substrate-binding protein [Bacteroidota bacterium]
NVRFPRAAYRLILVGALMALLAPGVQSVAAQNGQVIERHPLADSLLAAGLEAFEADRLDEARDLFARIGSETPVNAASSTARVMQAKAAFRTGDFAGVRTILAGFSVDFPGSRYAGSARTLEEQALEAERQKSEPPLQLGVILSLGDDERIPSQQLFNGIRLAVDAHNEDPRNRPVRMIFRDISGAPDRTAQVVAELKKAGADAIIGTLFSERAVAAADQADRDQIVFLAPMATDERVSQGHQYAFQANPTMQARGRAMARFAVNGLRLDSLGVITVADDRGVGVRLADGFIQEASDLGAQINLIQLLSSESEWFTLPDTLSADTLRMVNAIYVPMIAGNAPQRAGMILSAFDRFGRSIRLLGNASWHDLPQKAHASRYLMTYSNDFFPDLTSTDYLQFGWAYRDLSGQEAGRLGVSGFDTTSFLLEALSRRDSRTLVDRIRNMSAWEGFGTRIHFNGSNVNQALYFHRYRDDQLSLIR